MAINVNGIELFLFTVMDGIFYKFFNCIILMSGNVWFFCLILTLDVDTFMLILKHYIKKYTRIEKINWN